MINDLEREKTKLKSVVVHFSEINHVSMLILTTKRSGFDQSKKKERKFIGFYRVSEAEKFSN